VDCGGNIIRISLECATSSGSKTGMEVVMLERYFVKPETVDRIRASWIAGPIEGYVSWMAASRYLRKAGVSVRRAGSHTLRHTCVQRLADSGFPLKTIGDYVGHRSASSTEIYAKVAVETLRDVALGDGEALP
jgi:integrase/recombinase XerD